LQKKTIRRRTVIDVQSALIIEGIKNNRHFVIRAELGKSKGFTVIKVRPIELKKEYEKIRDTYVAKQFPVTAKNGMKLLHDVWNDRLDWNKEYEYFTSNCSSWCIEKLGLIKIDIRNSVYKYP